MLSVDKICDEICGSVSTPPVLQSHGIRHLFNVGVLSKSRSKAREVAVEKHRYGDATRGIKATASKMAKPGRF